MQRNLKNIAWFVGFAIAFAAVRYGQAGPDPLLQKAADKIMPDLPRQIDIVTRLDSVSAGPDNRFTYNYTLLSPEGEKLIQNNQDMRKAEMLTKACDAMPDFRRLGTTLDYNYKNAAGNKLTTLEISLKDCK
ncbi:MAG TPA: hypothetical protein VFT64_04960 [Rickettsiales bacterium]|nr:hypothetical protein [Rickettsiales bacterium]